MRLVGHRPRSCQREKLPRRMSFAYDVKGAISSGHVHDEYTANGVDERAMGEMKLDLTKPLFVFLGAWNRAILQPQWIARHLFGIPEGQSVQAGIFIDPTNPSEQILFISDVGVAPGIDRVKVYTGSFEPDVIGRAESAAIALFETLPHTPVGSFGVNYTYILEDPADTLLDQLTTKDALNLHYQVTGQTLTAAIRRDDGGTLNLARRPSEKNVVFDFNYHYETPPAVGAWRKRLEGLTLALHSESQNLLRVVYNVEMTGTTGFNMPIKKGGEQ